MFSDTTTTDMTEIALIQAMMHDNGVIPQVMSKLPPEAIDYPARLIYETIISLWREGSTPESALVASRAARTNPAILDVFPISSLDEGTLVTVSNWEQYANELSDAYITRVAVNQTGVIMKAALEKRDPTALPAAFMNAARVVSNAVNGGRSVASAANVADRYIDQIIRAASGETVVAIPTFIPGLDSVMNGGWHLGLLHTLFAMTSSGKTSVAMASALLGAFLNGTESLYLSFEMPKHELMDRFVSMLCGIPFQLSDLGRGNRVLRDDDFARIGRSPIAAYIQPGSVKTLSELGMAVSSAFAALPLYIDDTRMDIESTMSRVIAHTATHPATQLVFIDHMGMLKPSSKKSKYEDMDEAFSCLNELAIMNNIAIIALTQPNRELKDGEKPELYHLSYAGEKPSQRVLGLEVLSDAAARRFRIHVLKQRNGPRRTSVDVTMYMPTFTFVSGTADLVL